jgi:predicted metal-dependent hydrolase
MTETLRLGDVAIAVARKDVKHVHLSVHPPNGRVTLVAPLDARLEVVRAYATSKLGWIRKQQDRLRAQARETPRRYVERESHYLWGRRHVMTVIERDHKPEVSLDHRRIVLSVRPGSSQVKRADVLHEWHRALLHREVPPIIRRWESRLGVQVHGYFLQRMKTKWGSCNSASGTIRLNTELVKKPKDLLEYVIAHEMAHLIEPTHSSRFVAILDEHYPTWRDARVELNDLPLAAEAWQE